MHVVAPPENLEARLDASGISLTWNPPTEPVLGYHVYRTATVAGSFERLTHLPLTTPGFHDATGKPAANYMVRAIKLETSGSGTYFNLSQGAFLNRIGPANIVQANAPTKMLAAAESSKHPILDTTANMKLESASLASGKSGEEPNSISQAQSAPKTSQLSAPSAGSAAE
jgi:hypothetical protein